MGIVGEIVGACKTVLDSFLVGYTELDYQYIVETNSERSLTNRYGFTVGAGNFAEGRSMGHTTINQVFTLTLVNDYQNRDSDEGLQSVIYKQYDAVQSVLCQLQKSRLQLPTAGNMLLLISGLSFDEPEIITDNSIVVLRANFNIQYRYKNN